MASAARGLSLVTAAVGALLLSDDSERADKNPGEGQGVVVVVSCSWGRKGKLQHLLP